MKTANGHATSNLTQRRFDFLLQTLGLDPAACGPPASVTWPSITFVNYVHTIRITHQFKRVGIYITVIFPLAEREPVHKGWGYLPLKVWTSFPKQCYELQPFNHFTKRF